MPTTKEVEEVEVSGEPNDEPLEVEEKFVMYGDYSSEEKMSREEIEASLLRKEEGAESLGGIRITKEDYLRSVSVNGSIEFEEKWGVWKKIFGHIYLFFCVIDSLLMQGIFLLFVRPFLSKEHPAKKDPRRWPSSFIFYTPSTPARFLKKNSMTWKAIEYLYTMNDHLKPLRGIDRVMSSLLVTVENILATRNRLRSLKRELFWEIYDLLQNGEKEISIVSLASGSSRASIEVVAGILRGNPNLLDKFKLSFVDWDTTAFDLARDLARENFPGLETRLEFKKAMISGKPRTIRNLTSFLRSVKPNIIEMVGFTDYMSKEKAVIVMAAIRHCLKPGGLFITNNVKPNDEQRFLEVSVCWRMFNRTESEMLEIFHEAGFLIIKTLNEPTDIQPVYAVRKG